MSLKRTAWVIVVFAVAWLVAGCGTDSNDPLKAPGVYRDPQVLVTRAPTETAIDPAATDAAATAQPPAIQPLAGPTLDEEQFLMDEIERLLNKIESKLDRTDVNP